MSTGKYKMFKAERLSMILLAIILCVWAIISIVTHKSTVPNAVPVSQYADSLDNTSAIDSIKLEKPKKEKKAKIGKKARTRRSSAQKAKSAKPAPRKRDHLNEPINQY